MIMASVVIKFAGLVQEMSVSVGYELCSSWFCTNTKKNDILDIARNALSLRPCK